MIRNFILLLSCAAMVPSLSFSNEGGDRKYNKAYRSLIDRSPTKGIVPATAKDLLEERIDWLEMKAEFGDREAQEELQRISPDRFNKMFANK